MESLQKAQLDKLEYPTYDLSHSSPMSFSDFLHKAADICPGIRKVVLYLTEDTNQYTAYVWPAEGGYNALKQLKAFSFNGNIDKCLCYPCAPEITVDFSEFG